MSKLKRIVARRIAANIESSLPAHWVRGSDTAVGQVIGAVAWWAAGFSIHVSLLFMAVGVWMLVQ